MAGKEHHEFVSEAEEILERMLEELAELHDQRHEHGDVDPDLVNRVFRSAHSLKGLAGMFGLEAIGEIAHHLEDILDGLRLGRVPIDSPAVGLLDEGVSLLQAMMTRLEQNAAAPTEELDRARTFVARIGAAIESPAAPVAGPLDGLALEPSILRALTEYEEHRLCESLRRGRHLAMVESTFSMAHFEEGLAELSAAVREVGEVVSTLPSPGDAPESRICFSLLVATDIDAEQLAARLEIPDVSVKAIRRTSGTDTKAVTSEANVAQTGASTTPGEVMTAEASASIDEAPAAGASSDLRALAEAAGSPGSPAAARPVADPS